MRPQRIVMRNIFIDIFLSCHLQLQKFANDTFLVSMSKSPQFLVSGNFKRKPLELVHELCTIIIVFITSDSHTTRVRERLDHQQRSCTPRVHFRIVHQPRYPLAARRCLVTDVGVREARASLQTDRSLARECDRELPKTLHTAQMHKIRTGRVGGALRLFETCARTCSASL